METTNTDALWKAKHAFARAFYVWQLQELVIKLWSEISGKQPLRPSLWHKLVEHPEIWKMTWEKLCSLPFGTPFEMFGTELPDDGIEAITEESEIYFLVPLEQAKFPVGNGGVLETVADEGPRIYACQQMLKIIFIYAFAHIYQKQFKVIFKDREMTFDRDTILKPLHDQQAA